MLLKGQIRAQTQSQASRQQLTSVIPYSEIRNIQQKCFGADDNYKQIQKLELYAKSQERVKKWPNTINAIRKKKDQTRFERFKADEEERRRIEQEEALYQAQVKKEILERANQQIYENNDRVRAFQSKLLITDVVQEREAQLDMKRYKGEIVRAQEQMHHEEMLDNVGRLEQLEAIKIEQQQQKKKETHKVLKEQHDHMITTHIKVIQNEKIEGELNKAKALQAIQDEEDAAMARRRKKLENIADVKQGNEENKELHRQQRQKEIEEDQRIAAYAKKKDQILEMRKVREELKFREKQAERQKMIDRQIKLLEAKQQERDHILNKQIEEAEIKAEEVEKVKKEKREQFVQRINYSHKVSEEQRKKDLEGIQLTNVAKLNSDKEFQAYWKQRNQELLKQEADEKEDIRKRSTQLKQYHLAQMDEKQKLREQVVMKDLDEQEEILRKMENQNKTFGSWAERAIKEWSENGKNVQPLVKELGVFKQQ